MKLSEIFGWLAVGCLIIAYGLSVLGTVPASSLISLLLNLIGAIGIIISSYQKKNFQPVVINSFWAIVAGVGIIRFLLK